MKIKKYHQFIKENNHTFLDTEDGIRSLSLAINNVDLDNDSAILDICENLYNSDLITDDDRQEINKYIKNSLVETINENFFDKLKQRFDKAKEVATNLSDKAKGALETIVKAAKDIFSFIGDLKNKLLNSIKDIFSNAVSKIMGKLKADQKFTSETKEVAEKNKEGLAKDLSTAKEVIKFHKEEMPKKLVDIISNALKGFLSKEDQGQPAVAEKLNIINEGTNNMISKLIDGLAHVPPFSWLHEVQKIGTKGATHIISAISKFTEKIGGSPFTLPIIAGLLGIAFELNVKGLAKSGLINVVGYFTIPFVTIIISIIGWIATFMATIAVINELSGSAEHAIEH